MKALFCTHCGKALGTGDKFCRHCGGAATIPQIQGNGELTFPHPPADGEERLLFSFGPFGYSFCKGPYSIWSWHSRNIMRYDITNRRFRTIHQFALPFSATKASQLDIPLEALVAVQHYPRPGISLGIMEVLGIKYRDSASLAEVSISGYRDAIVRACELLQQLIRK